MLLVLQNVPWAGNKWLDTGVLWFLIILSVLIAIIIITKYLKFVSAKEAGKLYAPEVAKLIKKGKWSEVICLSNDFSKKSHIAKVVLQGLEEREALQDREFPEKLIPKYMGHAMQRCTIRTKNEYKWGLGILDAIGSTAPFIGALGGSAFTFACGIILAIPTIWFATHFRNRIEMFDSEMRDAESDLTSYLEKLHS